MQIAWLIYHSMALIVFGMVLQDVIDSCDWTLKSILFEFSAGASLSLFWPAIPLLWWLDYRGRKAR